MVWCTCFFCITCLQQIVCKCEYNMHALCMNYSILLHKHQWNTRWAFTWKLDIFTCENNMLSSHVKISPLLWLHNKLRLSHPKNYLSEMVWYFIGVYIINRTLHGHLEIRNFSSCVDKIFHSFAAHSWNIFQHEKRNFVSLCGHVIISSMYLPVLDAMQLLQGENYYSWNIHIRSIGKV